jgi:hypothetical protein
MNQSESKVKKMTRRSNLATYATRIFLGSILLLSISYSQSFDLLSAKVSDKIAQSRFFKIDSNKVLNAYEINSFSVPVARIQDSVFVVAGIHASVSAAKNSGVNPVKDFSLEQNYPNPFNPSTTFSFNLPTKSFVSLKVFDLIGREAATIFSGELSAGSYTKKWNAANMSSGIYFYRLQAGSFIETKKLVLLK